MRLAYITLFGALGVLSRHYMGLSVSKFLPHPFPFGTFLINLLGAFAIGIIYVFGIEKATLPEDLRIGIIVGYLGGFTTFSSYCLEVVRLVEDGKYGYATAYAGLSTLLGFGCSFMGIFLSRALLSRA